MSVSNKNKYNFYLNVPEEYTSKHNYVMVIENKIKQQLEQQNISTQGFGTGSLDMFNNNNDREQKHLHYAIRSTFENNEQIVKVIHEVSTKEGAKTYKEKIYFYIIKRCDSEVDRDYIKKRLEELNRGEVLQVDKQKYFNKVEKTYQDTIGTYKIKTNFQINEEKLNLGHAGRVKVEICYPEPARCYQCQAFGHKAYSCKKNPICGVCAQKHPTNECLKKKKQNIEVKKKCANCKEEHEARFFFCNVRRQYIAQMIKNINNVRDIASTESHPDTTNKEDFPHIVLENKKPQETTRNTTNPILTDRQTQKKVYTTKQQPTQQTQPKQGRSEQQTDEVEMPPRQQEEINVEVNTSQHQVEEINKLKNELKIDNINKLQTEVANIKNSLSHHQADDINKLQNELYISDNLNKLQIKFTQINDNLNKLLSEVATIKDLQKQYYRDEEHQKTINQQKDDEIIRLKEENKIKEAIIKNLKEKNNQGRPTTSTQQINITQNDDDLNETSTITCGECQSSLNKTGDHTHSMEPHKEKLDNDEDIKDAQELDDYMSATEDSSSTQDEINSDNTDNE